MEYFLTANWDEGTVRLAVFLFTLTLFAVLEAILPEARRKYSRGSRWLTNISMVVVATLLTRVALPLLAIDSAIWAQEHNIGLFHFLGLPYWLSFIAALLLLDLLLYGQHVLTHRVSILWALHKVHHCDREIDVTTALRFHPLEILLSMVLKISVVLILGAPILAVIVFEIILSSAAIFNHSNLYFSDRVDALLRKLFVTPKMHRIHHSVAFDEHNHNFGFSISLWDRLFNTYRDQPRQNYAVMPIGLENYQKSGPERLLWSLQLPFKKDVS